MVWCGTPDWQLAWSCQGGSRGREGIPLNNCLGEKWVFVVDSPSINLPVCQWVGSLRDVGQGDYVWRERHCDISMYYFTEKDQLWASMPLLRGKPTEFSQHVWDTWIWWVITQDPPSCLPLDHLNFMCVVKSVWVLDWSSILQLGTDNGLVISLSSVFLALRFLLKKPRDLFAVFVILVIWGFHDKSLAMSMPRYFAEDTTSSVWPCKVYEVWSGYLDGVTQIIWHFPGLNSISQSVESFKVILVLYGLGKFGSS